LYDANGNILSMRQMGMNGITPQTIDSLKYGYVVNSNKLSFVTDKRNNPQSILGDFKEINNNETEDYNYDLAGNLTKDRNKGIDTIILNQLNLPSSIILSNKGMITYQYDVAGNKLRKTVLDITNGQNKTTVTDYVEGMVYQQDSLQYLPHEEGRIRTIYKTGSPVAYTYDYFEKDHLGNVRIVLGTRSDTAQYAATMETSAAALENALFANIDNTRSPEPNTVPADNGTNPNVSVAKVNGNGGQKIGPSLVLRVMAGDTIYATVKGLYIDAGTINSYYSSTDMITSLAQVFATAGVSDGIHAGTGSGSPIVNAFTHGQYETLTNTYSDQSTRPKAYLSYVLFDDQFNMVSENSGVKQFAATPNTWQPLTAGPIIVKKSGFLYIYTNNESQTDVYYDNLVVSHKTGPLLEDTHYYPYGLTMAGISGHALKGAGYTENKLRYNGKEIQNEEFGDGSGLEWYDYGARMQDPQNGRWYSIDPHSENYYEFSPYNYGANNPISVIDPNGMDITTYTGADAVAVGRQLVGGAGINDILGGPGKGQKVGQKKGQTAFIPAIPFAIEGGAELLGAAAATEASESSSSFSMEAMMNEMRTWPRYWVFSNGGHAGELAKHLWDDLFGVDRPAIPVDPALVQKMVDELTNITNKNSNKRGNTYILRALTDGWYNYYVSGIKLPVFKVPLHAGQVWKIGETTDPDNRYDAAYLAYENVRIDFVFSGNQQAIKAVEKVLIYHYYFNNGILPPGNKLFR
jgi:RHS repeat-associated protein